MYIEPKYEEVDGGREDDSMSDSDDESRATRRCMLSTDKGNNNGSVSEAVFGRATSQDEAKSQCHVE